MILECQGKENFGVYGVRPCCSTEINMHLPTTFIEQNSDIFIHILTMWH